MNLSCYVHFLDLDVQPPDKFLSLPPPPPAWSAYSATTPPPPTESGRLLEITQNLPGDIGRVAPPPKKKSWLRRCEAQ